MFTEFTVLQFELFGPSVVLNCNFLKTSHRMFVDNANRPLLRQLYQFCFLFRMCLTLLIESDQKYSIQYMFSLIRDFYFWHFRREAQKLPVQFYSTNRSTNRIGGKVRSRLWAKYIIYLSVRSLYDNLFVWSRDSRYQPRQPIAMDRPASGSGS